MENTSDSFMPGSLLFCMKSKKSVCYSVADNTQHVQRVTIVYRNFGNVYKRKMKEKLKKNMKLKG